MINIPALEKKGAEHGQRIMITFFATPKPFHGHINVIQRNAIQSWQHLHPDVEIILLGPEDGAMETARELGLRFEPRIPCNEFGTVLLSGLFDRAQELARHERICFVNCDIIFPTEFLDAVRAVAGWRTESLMVGRRWDLDVTEPLDFSSRNWAAALRATALQADRQRPSQWIDYFVFKRGLFHKRIPPFAVGRPGYDNWLIWRARSLGCPVVDVSRDVVAIHQNHDYSHHPGGEKGVWEGEEARRNAELLGSWLHFCTVEDATHRLNSGCVEKSHRHAALVAQRAARRYGSAVWFKFLQATRPLRHRLGLRRHPLQG
jgi:hypothetical protein